MVAGLACALVVTEGHEEASSVRLVNSPLPYRVLPHLRALGSRPYEDGTTVAHGRSERNPGVSGQNLS